MIDFNMIKKLAAEGKRSYGVRRILRERGRQIVVHGYDAQHDKTESINSLLSAAYAYMLASMDGHNNNEQAKDYWPWDPALFKPRDKERNLAKAGALIAAAIDKLNEQ